MLCPQHAKDIKVKAVGALTRILMIAKGLFPWRIPFAILHMAIEPSVESLKPLFPCCSDGNCKVSSPILINFFDDGKRPEMARIFSNLNSENDAGKALALAIATKNDAEELCSQQAKDIKGKAVGALTRILMIAKRLFPWRIPFAILHMAIEPSVESLKPLFLWWNESLSGGNIKVSSPFRVNFIIGKKMPEMARSLSSPNSVRKDDQLFSICENAALVVIATEQPARLCLDPHRLLVEAMALVEQKDGPFMLLFLLAFISHLTLILPIM